MLILSRWKNNIPVASQLSVCTCRILSFIEHIYCFFRSSKFQLAVDCPGLVLFLTGRDHDDNGAQRSSRYLLASGPPALVIFCLTTSACSFFTESNTQPSSIFLLKRMSYIRFLISTYSFTSSYTRIIILKIRKVPFSYLHPYFCCCFPSQCWFFYHWFSLKPTQLSHVLFAYKNKTIFLANQ